MATIINFGSDFQQSWIQLRLFHQDKMAKMDIQSLPNELLLRIFGEFALQPHETGYPILHEYRRDRSVLLKLSTTTHKFSLAANSLLYETIITDHPSTLISLLRTVSHNKQAASHVKHIACLMTLDSNMNDKFQYLWQDLSLQISNLAPDAVHLFHLAGLASETPTRPIDHAGERILATLLALLPNLQSIVFQPPHTISPGSPPPAPYHTMSSILDNVLTDNDLGPIALAKLTTVKIQPKTSPYGEPFPGTRCDACMGLLRAPNLAIFETYHEAGGWAALPHSLRDVRLFGSLEPDTLDIVCDKPNLERLTVQPHPDEHVEANIQHDAFNTALAKRVSTLKYLQLVTMGNETLMPSYGPRKYIHCIGDFQCMEELDIEIFALFIDSTNIDPEKSPQLQDLVPRGLKTLSLWERWAPGDPAYVLGREALIAYRERLHKMLTSFAQSCGSGRMTAMRTFRLERHSSLTQIMGRLESPAMESLKRSFAEAGVTMELGIF